MSSREKSMCKGPVTEESRVSTKTWKKTERVEQRAGSGVRQLGREGKVEESKLRVSSHGGHWKLLAHK